MMLCTGCGKQNSNANRFCTFCGDSISNSCVVGRMVLLDDKEGEEYLFADVERFIGREAGNDIVIVDTQMSARHVRVSQANGEFWVEDLHSTNGTFVNGRRIGARTRLCNDDLLKMGRTLFKFEV